jgi:hypothetical protein
MDSILNTILPYLMEILSLVLTAIIGWAAAAVKKKWGIEIEASQREALHSALLTGSQLAIQHKLTGKAAVDLVLSYIKQSVPGAISGLGATDEVLTSMAKAKLDATAAAVPATAVTEPADVLTDALRAAGAVA